MRKAKTAISGIKINGILRYRLTYPTSAGRKREHFTKEKDAKQRLKEIKDEQARYGSEITGYTAMMRADSIAAMKELDGTGKTLLDAARFLRSHLLREMSGKPITEAVEAFLASRSGFSELHRKNCEGWGKKISSAFPDRTTNTLTPADCQAWIDGLAGLYAPATVEIGKKMLSAVMTFAVDRKWATSNPASKAVLPPAKTEDPEIISPLAFSTLLSDLPAELLPAAVLAGFCGIRRAEINRLQWSAVNLAAGTVTIGAGIAKTGSRRVCPIPENAKAWLASYAQQSGNVLAEGKDVALELACRALAFPKNALRHSAISYKLAMAPDLSRVAYESGNSPKVIQEHYNGLAEQGDAILYFSITPDEPANVTRPQFKAA
jgi:integrase